MTKKTKIYLGAGLIVLGIFLAITLNSGEKEDSGVLPPPNDDGKIPPADSGAPQTVEEQNEVGNPSEIIIGDFITPYSEFTRVRETMSLDNGFDDNYYEDGDLDAWGYADDGKVYSGNIIGKVTNIIEVGENKWYSVDVCAIVNGVYDTLPNVQLEMAQDGCNSPVGFVIQSIALEDGTLIPNVKKVI